MSEEHTKEKELERLEQGLAKLSREAELNLSSPFVNERVKNSDWIQQVFQSLIHTEDSAKQLTPEEKDKFIFHLKEELTGVHASAVMICRGSDCPICDTCPLYGMKKAPKGKKCPIEVAIAWDAVKKYADELGVGDDEYIDQTIVTRLAAYDVYEHRIQKILETKLPELVDESASGEYDNDGNPIQFKHISHEWNIKENIEARRERLLKSIVGTRYEKYRRDVATKKRDTDDPAAVAARTREKYDELAKKYREKRTIIETNTEN